MRAAIFTEGSSTTGKSMQSYSDYFEGSFLSVNTLAEELSTHCETEVHILSDTYGYVRGQEEIDSNQPVELNAEIEQVRECLLSQVGVLDVVVLLFTTDVFKQILTPHWETIVEQAKTDLIWCIGTSQSALNSVNLELLESQHPVLIYQRRGVARVGTETREELIDYVSARLDE